MIKAQPIIEQLYPLNYLCCILWFSIAINDMNKNNN